MKTKELFHNFKNDLVFADKVSKIETIIKKYGWNFIDRGNEAAIAMHPNKKYVLKIFLYNSKYKDFVKLVQKDPSNPHFPKFFGPMKKIPFSSYFYSIKMEILKPFNIIDSLPYHVNELAYLAEQCNESGLNLAFAPVINEFFKNTYGINFFLPPGQFKVNPQARRYWKLPSMEWANAVNLICKSTPVNVKYIDLHSKNFMLRDNTLVIIDPF